MNTKKNKTVIVQFSYEDYEKDNEYYNECAEFHSYHMNAIHKYSGNTEMIYKFSVVKDINDNHKIKHHYQHLNHMSMM